MFSKQLLIRSIIFSLPFILLLFLYGLLRDGIRLESISVAGFQLEKLYLKLDKKLILKAGRIYIPRDKRSPRIEGVGRGLDRLHMLLRFFRSIELEDVIFTNDHYSILYADHIIYITSRKYELAGMVYNRGRWMEMRFPLFYIKKYQATFSGILSYHYRSGDFWVRGKYSLPGIGGKFRVQNRNGKLKFKLHSGEAESLDRLIPVFSFRGSAREWLESRLKAGKYRLEYLAGEGTFNAKEGFLPDFDSFQGGVDLRDVEIRFHDKLYPITAPHARIMLKNGGLYFHLDRPAYYGKSLEGSSAALLYLDKPGRLTLLLRLKYNGRLDWKILRILHVYGVPLKLGQKSGKVKASLDMDIPLEKGILKLRGIGRISPGILEVEGREFRTGGGEVAFTKESVALRGISVEGEWGSATLDGILKLKEKRGDLELHVRKFEWGSPVPVFSMKKKKIPIRLKWNEKKKNLTIPLLASEVVYQNAKGLEWNIKDLTRWRPWLKGPLCLLEGGTLSWKSHGKDRMRLAGDLKWPASPFYTKKGKLTDVPFVLSTAGDYVKLQAFGDRLAYSSGNHTLRIRTLNIDGERVMDALKKIGGTDRMQQKLTIKGEKSLIRYGPYVLLTDAYRLDLDGQKLSFSGILGKDRITLKKNGRKVHIKANRIGDRMLHALIHFDGLQEGKYTLNLKGEVGRDYTGEIIIEGGVLRDVKAYNDLIAMINTVPALMAFSSPGFSRKGFELKRGRIVFRLKGDLLTLTSILLEGKSSTVAGRGTVNLKSRKLDIVLGIRTAREMGKAVGHIPVVGYILFGKDQSLTAGVRIEGTIEKPRVRTNPVGDALLYPLQILKRTLMAPAQLATPSVPQPLAEVPRTRESNATSSHPPAPVPGSRKQKAKESKDIY